MKYDGQIIPMLLFCHESNASFHNKQFPRDIFSIKKKHDYFSVFKRTRKNEKEALKKMRNSLFMYT